MRAILITNDDEYRATLTEVTTDDLPEGDVTVSVDDWGDMKDELEVMVAPGQMQLTRTPLSPNSTAAERVRWTIAALAVV